MRDLNSMYKDICSNLNVIDIKKINLIPHYIMII